MRASSWATPALANDPAAATYSAIESTTRISSVVPPLHRTSLRRTRRMSALSAVSAACSGAVVSLGGWIPSGICQTIAHPSHGLDQPAGRPELVAEVVDVCVDGIRRDRDAERPRLVEQLVTRERLPRMTEQAFEERELPWTEIDALAV